MRIHGIFVALLVLAVAGGAQAQAPCPADATALAEGAKLSCTCAAGASGGVYGSTRYTADSSICTAAVHAGKVPASGGPVNIVVGGACASFTGTAANGVTTTSWSSYDKTFGFDALPACAVAAAPAAPAATAPASTAGGVADCPSFIGQSSKSKPGDSLTCVCPSNIDFTIGAAYGTDRYSHDSPICMSAKHAGKLPQPGATITVYVAEGCGKFEGTARNDITTRSWGSTTPGTIAFVSPPPACVAPAAAPAPTTATAPRPATPAGPNPMIAWEARAKTYVALLPAPLAGWEPQAPVTRVQNSAIAGREVTAYRIYRIGFHPMGMNSVTVSIYNNPDGSAGYPIEIWNSEAKRKEANATMVKLAGRDAMETKTVPSGGVAETGYTISFLTKNNLFVTVSWQEPHMTRDKALEYVKALDFAKIEALASK